MISKKMKTFIIEGVEYQFNVTKFKELFNRYAMKKEALKGEYENEIADLLFVDSSAIHNWRMGLNGPGDLDKIHNLEKFWKLSENSLLSEVKEMENAMYVLRPLTDGEREFIKKVYFTYDRYVMEFCDSYGFKYAIDFDEMEDESLSNDDRTPYDKDEAHRLLGKFCDLIEEEGFFLLNKKVYDVMLDFLSRARMMMTITFCTDLEEIYDMFELEKENMSYSGLFDGMNGFKIYEGERQLFRDKVEPFLAV